LLGSIGLIYDHDFESINETRLLYSKQLLKTQNLNPETILIAIPYIQKNKIFQISASNFEESRLIISNLLRNAEIHHYNGLIFSKEFWPYLNGQIIKENKIANVFNSDELLKIPEIMARSNLEEKVVLKLLEEAIQDQLIENTSPFVGIMEYRLIMKKRNYLPNKLKIKLVKYFIENSGPIDFKSLLDKCQMHFSFSRIELLLLLSDLTESKDLFTSLIVQKNTKIIYYFNRTQKLILQDPIRKNQFDKWEIIEDYHNVFPYINNQGTHLLLFQGTPIFSFKMKRIIDYAKISTLNFVFDTNEVNITPMFEEIFGFIEDYIFSIGLRGLIIEKIEGNSPENWIKT
ncbi:MAG: hypothetical protein ACC656_00135, partial [Candidatus Heimdallarchaeota archaeon]